MKVLLDENLPHDLRHFLPEHEVVTVAHLGWQGIENGELLSRAAANGFDALVSMDAGIEHQFNLTNLPIAVILLRARSNALEVLRPIVPALLQSLATMRPKTMMRVPDSP